KHDSHTVPWGAFWRLVLIQAQNSFNETGAQFLLIPLGVWLYGTQGDLEYPLGAIIVLPFILFSPFVGWLSDRFCKARIIQFMALLQICVLGGMYWSLRSHNLNGAILWFCVFALQATIFSPSKKGIVKDIVGTSRMGFASGIVKWLPSSACSSGRSASSSGSATCWSLPRIPSGIAGWGRASSSGLTHG
ncbi:MAG: hypothetical protein ACLSUW_05845, partial [Akkermansia sp.]